MNKKQYQIPLFEFIALDSPLVCVDNGSNPSGPSQDGGGEGGQGIKTVPGRKMYV